VKKEKINLGFIFDEILGIFFSNTEINQFQKAVAKKKVNTNKSDLTKTDRMQIEFGPNKQTEIQRNIDLLVTFASEKLSSKRFLVLIQSLGKYCITIGEFDSAIILFEKIINANKKEKNLFILEADAFLSLSEVYRRKTQWQNSFAYVRKASYLYKKNNDSKGLAGCLNLTGTIYGEQGNFKKAQDYFEKSLSLLEKSRDNEFKGKIEINLGIINGILGKYDDALSYFSRALITYNKTSNLKRIAEVRHNIGQMHISTQKSQTALKEFDRSISTSIRIGYLPTLGISYLGKSYAFALQKDYNLADAFADKAMEICHRTSDKLSIADVYKIKGIIHRDKKNYAEAENFLKTSLRINKEHGNKLNEAETLYELGILYRNIGSTTKSKAMFNEALNYFRSLKASEKLKEIKGQIANLSAA
jgi:tetratricopeptide (TPR) repeat protein